MLIFSKVKKKLRKKLFLLNSLKIKTSTGIFEGFCQNFENTFFHTAFLNCKKPPNLLQIISLEDI